MLYECQHLNYWNSRFVFLSSPAPLHRKLFIAHTLSRHFSWSHNTLFVEDLPARDAGGASPAITTTVVLSGGDSIVPTERVKLYLEQHQHREDLEVVFLEGQQHGQMMVSPRLMRMVGEKIKAACMC